jgi:hypothetical protein
VFSSIVASLRNNLAIFNFSILWVCFFFLFLCEIGLQ